METKSKRIDLRASQSDQNTVQKAASLLGTTTVSETIFKSLENFVNQPPEMYYCDRQAIRQIDAYIEYIGTHLANFVNEFIHITGQSCSLKEIEIMFRGWSAFGGTSIIQAAIKGLIEQTLVDRLRSKYPGLPVETPKLDLTRLFELADKLSDAPAIKHFKSVFYPNCFTISKSGEVTVIPDQVEILKNAYRATASSPLELQRLAKIRFLCETLNSFLTDENFLPEQIPALYYFDRESARFEPTGAHIKSFSPMRVLPD